MTSDPAIDVLRAEFELPLSTLSTVADEFANAMREGLAGRTSSLRMLPSFLIPPTGEEHCAVLAMDFGGTNVRVLNVELRGRGAEPVVRQRSYPLVDAAAGYDFVSARADATELFDFLAAKLAAEGPYDVHTRLGLTFSFPCEQRAVDRARLINWTKEFATRGVEGEDIGDLLSAALRRAGLHNVHPVVILNDTVGTLLSAGYQLPNVEIGAICGTGHNTCYLEPLHPLTGAPMLVNLESGNFDAVPVTRFDAALDRSSEQPGAQRLEKLVAGRYLGELLKLVLLDLYQLGALQIPGTPRFSALRGEALVISELLAAEGAASSAAAATEAALLATLGVQVNDPLSLQRIRSVAALIANRSSSLVAATFVGVGRYLASTQRSPRSMARVVAIDGSVFEKMPGYAAHLQQTLDLLTQVPAAMVAVRAKDGSGIGAAIAAATIS